MFDLIERLLTSVALPRNYCFAEADAGDAGGGGSNDAAGETEGGEDSEGDDSAQAAEGEGDEGSEEEDDSEDVDYEGTLYRVPKPLKEALLRQVDYTQKTQTHAERVKQHEAWEKSQREAYQLREVAQGEMSEFKNVETSVTKNKEALSKWQALSPADWQQYRKEAGEDQYQYARDTYQALKDERDVLLDKHRGLWGSIQGKLTDLRSREEGERKTQSERIAAEIAKAVPGWNDQKQQALTKWAADSYGATPDQVAVALTGPLAPFAVRVLNDLMGLKSTALKAIVKTKAGAPGPAAQSRPVARPVTPVRGANSKATSAPSDNDDAETWRKKRNAQVQTRRGPSGQFRSPL